MNMNTQSKLWPDYEKHLTLTEARIFLALEKDKSITRMAILTLCVGIRGRGVPSNKADVHIMHLRKKLPKNLRIATVRGDSLTPGRYVLEARNA